MSRRRRGWFPQPCRLRPEGAGYAGRSGSPAVSVPALITVLPVYVLPPLSTRRPPPCFVSEPLPLMGPEIASVSPGFVTVTLALCPKPLEWISHGPALSQRCGCRAAVEVKRAPPPAASV